MAVFRRSGGAVVLRVPSDGKGRPCLLVVAASFVLAWVLLLQWLQLPMLYHYKIRWSVFVETLARTAAYSVAAGGTTLQSVFLLLHVGPISQIHAVR